MKAKTWAVGPGWRQLSGSVFEHASGVRIHIYGMCLLPDGECVYRRKRPWDRFMYQCIRIHGGNRRRGIMAWALRLQAEKTDI
jgi:plasmid replication initiation protein